MACSIDLGYQYQPMVSYADGYDSLRTKYQRDNVLQQVMPDLQGFQDYIRQRSQIEMSLSIANTVKGKTELNFSERWWIQTLTSETNVNNQSQQQFRVCNDAFETQIVNAHQVVAPWRGNLKRAYRDLEDQNNSRLHMISEENEAPDSVWFSDNELQSSTEWDQKYQKGKRQKLETDADAELSTAANSDSETLTDQNQSGSCFSQQLSTQQGVKLSSSHSEPETQLNNGDENDSYLEIQPQQEYKQKWKEIAKQNDENIKILHKLQEWQLKLEEENSTVQAELTEWTRKLTEEWEAQTQLRVDLWQMKYFHENQLSTVKEQLQKHHDQQVEAVQTQLQKAQCEKSKLESQVLDNRNELQEMALQIQNLQWKMDSVNCRLSDRNVKLTKLQKALDDRWDQAAQNNLSLVAQHQSSLERQEKLNLKLKNDLEIKIDDLENEKQNLLKQNQQWLRSMEQKLQVEKESNRILHGELQNCQSAQQEAEYKVTWLESRLLTQEQKHQQVLEEKSKSYQIDTDQKTAQLSFMQEDLADLQKKNSQLEKKLEQSDKALWEKIGSFDEELQQQIWQGLKKGEQMQMEWAQNKDQRIEDGFKTKYIIVDGPHLWRWDNRDHLGYGAPPLDMDQVMRSLRELRRLNGRALIDVYFYHWHFDKYGHQIRQIEKAFKNQNFCFSKVPKGNDVDVYIIRAALRASVSSARQIKPEEVKIVTNDRYMEYIEDASPKDLYEHKKKKHMPMKGFTHAMYDLMVVHFAFGAGGQTIYPTLNTQKDSQLNFTQDFRGWHCCGKLIMTAYFIKKGKFL